MADTIHTSPDLAGSKAEVLLNDRYPGRVRLEAARSSSTFEQFGRLPAEIRCIIWEHALLAGNRLIGIHVWQDERLPKGTRPTAYGSKNRLNKTVSGVGYRLRLSTRHRPSALFATCREARQVAQRFYRVHIPFDPYGLGENGCLYINPELDYLRITTPVHLPELFAYLAFDVLSYDPQNAGIQNLVVQFSSVSGHLAGMMNYRSLRPEILAALRSTITNLKKVYFWRRVHTEARRMCTLLGLTRIQYNRSFPISAQEEGFEVLEADPRAIDSDLEQVTVMRDLRQMLYDWEWVERGLQIDRSTRAPDYQYLLNTCLDGTYDNGKGVDAASREEAIDKFHAEQKLWRDCWDDDGKYVEPLWNFSNPDTPETLARAPLPAFGFWLLPLAVFGRPRDVRGQVPQHDPRNISYWESKKIVDLRQHRPRLGVFHLY